MLGKSFSNKNQYYMSLNKFGFVVQWHINIRGLFNTTAVFLEEPKKYNLTHSSEGGF